jgi:hypothetical protein
VNRKLRQLAEKKMQSEWVNVIIKCVGENVEVKTMTSKRGVRRKKLRALVESSVFGFVRMRECGQWLAKQYAENETGAERRCKLGISSNLFTLTEVVSTSDSFKLSCGKRTNHNLQRWVDHTNSQGAFEKSEK